MSTQHLREAQQLAPGALVELFTLDTSMLSNIYGQPGTGTIYNWTSGTINGQSVSLGGVAYPPMPIEASGWEWNGQGKLPRPLLQVSNVGGLATALVYEFGDLLGAVVTRQRTFVNFLDGQPNADPTALFPADVMRIDRKSHHGKDYIEWELAAEFDQQNVRLPRRQTLRDACSNTYRTYNGGFYAGSCPYSGGNYFDISNNQVFDPSLDVCSHRLSGCLARYPNGQTVPFTGFPGVAQTVTAA